MRQRSVGALTLVRKRVSFGVLVGFFEATQRRDALHAAPIVGQSVLGSWVAYGRAADAAVKGRPPSSGRAIFAPTASPVVVRRASAQAARSGARPRVTSAFSQGAPSPRAVLQTSAAGACAAALIDGALAATAAVSAPPAVSGRASVLLGEVSVPTAARASVASSLAGAGTRTACARSGD